MRSTWRRYVNSAALVLKTVYTWRDFKYAIMGARSRLSSGSPTPCSTARRRSGNWSTMDLNSSSDSWRAASWGENVSGHVAHLLLQRLATSKYASTGVSSAVPEAARLTMSSRGDDPVGAATAGLLTSDD